LSKDLKELKAYPYTDHCVINRKIDYPWQDKDSVLRLFAKTDKKAVRAYNAFVAKRVDQGQRPELIGDGLVRSGSGWSNLKALRLQGGG